MDITGYQLYFYDGDTGIVYKTVDTSSTGLQASNEDGISGFTFTSISVFERTNEVRNGPDAIALVDAEGKVVDFISYGGVVTAQDGPAAGETAFFVGATEPANLGPQNSIQLSGNGIEPSDFIWQPPQFATPGLINTDQSFACPVVIFCPNDLAFINEIHYQNRLVDVTEFVEIASRTSYSLEGHKLVFYDGDSGRVYKTEEIGGELDVSNDDPRIGFTFTAVSVFTIDNEVQNGPDAIALVDERNNVLDFISYGGTVTAIDGPAEGQTATLMGVVEDPNILPTNSLQLGGIGAQPADFGWQSSQLSTPGSINTGQVIECTLATSPPIKSPTAPPTESPTGKPSDLPTQVPSVSPSVIESDLPSIVVDVVESDANSLAPLPTVSFLPTAISITSTIEPTKSPTDLPTKVPTKSPTDLPTKKPTKSPTDLPTKGPTKLPTQSPIAIAGCPSDTIFINEIHYQGRGPDFSEFVELAYVTGFDLTLFRLVFYDADDGKDYKEVDLGTYLLSVPLEDADSGFTFHTFSVYQINNELRDINGGIALVSPTNNVLQFLAYGKQFTATQGPAAGETAELIDTSEQLNGPATNSLQLGGVGKQASDFFWQEPLTATTSLPNRNQVIVCS